MPATRFDKRKDYNRLRALVSGAIEANEMTRDEVASVLGMCERSARDYLKVPEKLPLGTLLKLCRVLGIPIDDLKGCIQY